MNSNDEVTALLGEMSGGDESVADKLLPVVYDDLRRLAHAYFTNERQEHTLQATALVHEAYIRLVNWENVSWQNRAHFFAVAAEVMRRILVDHARAKSAQNETAVRRYCLTTLLACSPKRRSISLCLKRRCRRWKRSIRARQRSSNYVFSEDFRLKRQLMS